MNSTMQSSQRFLRISALGGIIGPLIFILLIIVGGIYREGYSHLSQAISELGETGSSVQLLQILNFILMGLMLTVFALGFHYKFPGSTKLTTGLLLYFSIFAGIGNGIFPCDPGCEGVTLIGLLHNLTGATGFIMISLGMLLIGRRMRLYVDWVRWSRYTQTTGILIFAFMLIWLIAGPAGKVLPAVHGLFQRLMAFSILQWYMVIGLFVLHKTKTSVGQKP